MNVLVVEDEVLIAEAIKNILEKLKVVNTIDVAHGFQEGYEKAFSDAFDILIIDICLGDEDLNGLDLCASFRKSHPSVPIIVSTSLHSMQHLERAFELGVNDYITKPFHPRELMLRVKRWFGTTKPTLKKPDFSYKDLTYDAARHEFFWHKEKLSLSRRNKDLLLLFLKQPEQLLTHQFLKEKFWGDYSDRPRNVRASVQELRKSLARTCPPLIATVRGEGYILQKPL